MNPNTVEFNQGQQHTLFPKGRLLAIFILVWLALFAGINSIPVEHHEAYVLQTSREMNQNGDWVVPYFNQLPRMNKPPLNYWLTAGMSYIDPFNDDVEPWHGRVWSLFGGLLLVLMTAYTGNKLYGAPVGFLASALMLGTKGFSSFAHDARPDGLYSVLCVLMFFCWIAAWSAEDDSPAQRINAALGWVLAGVATLGKGPQVPVIFLVGFLIFLVTGVDRPRILKILRPFSGLCIWLALCLPWWLLFQERIRALGIDFSKTQLSGSLLKTFSGWKEISSFFYVSRLLNILLPVSLLLPIIFYFNRQKFRSSADGGRFLGYRDKLLLYAPLILLVVFTIVGQKRSRYMLPLIPFITLLLARVATLTDCKRLSNKTWLVLFWLVAAALLVFPVFFFIKQQYVTGLLLAAAGFMLILLLKRELQEPVWRNHSFASVVLVFSLSAALVLAGDEAYSFRSSRIWDRDFSLAVGKIVLPGDQVLALRSIESLTVLPYYSRHSVISVNEFDDLKKRFVNKSAGQSVYVIVRQDLISDMMKYFKVSMLLDMGERKASEDKLVFIKIQDMLH